MMLLQAETMQMWRRFRDQANKVLLNGQPLDGKVAVSFNDVLAAMREWHKDYEAFMQANKDQADVEADALAYMTTGDKDLETLIDNDRY